MFNNVSIGKWYDSNVGRLIWYHLCSLGAQECKDKDDENAITKRSELKDERDQDKEQEKQAQESEILQNEITNFEDKVKQNNEVITEIETALTDAKEITKQLRFKELQKLKQELKSLQDKVNQQEEVIKELISDLENEIEKQQDLRSCKC